MNDEIDRLRAIVAVLRRFGESEYWFVGDNSDGNPQQHVTLDGAVDVSPDEAAALESVLGGPVQEGGQQ